MSLYDRVKKRVESVREYIYFNVSQDVRRSGILTWKNLVTFLVVLGTAFLFSGGLIAIDNPFQGIFSPSSTSQSTTETVLFFFANITSIGGVVLMGRSTRGSRVDTTSLLLGISLFLVGFLGLGGLVCSFKTNCF